MAKPAQWEYATIRLCGDLKSDEEQMNRMGAKGFELVVIHLFPHDGAHMIFKRPRESK